jgi:ABC-type amino acid transport substrate-binding protein
MDVPISTLLRWVARLATSVLVCGCALAGAESIPKVRIGVQRNAPPLSFLDADNKLQGFTPALVLEMGRLGLFEPEVKVDYRQHNLNAFSARQIDVVADVAATEERRSVMEFSVASATNHAVLFQREDATPLTRSAALRGRTIGVLTRDSLGRLSGVASGNRCPSSPLRRAIEPVARGAKPRVRWRPVHQSPAGRPDGHR